MEHTGRTATKTNSSSHVIVSVSQADWGRVLWLISLTIWCSDSGLPLVLDMLLIKAWNRESIKCYLQMSPKCCLSQRPSTTWHRGFQLTYQELWESASAKTTTFRLRARSSQLYGDFIRGQVCVHYRCSSINAQDSNLAWSFSVYVHCASFSIYLGNFIKMKKSYNRYLAFDPLFALVWCGRLSNDTKHCASWLYFEITKWKDRALCLIRRGEWGERSPFSVLC